MIALPLLIGLSGFALADPLTFQAALDQAEQYSPKLAASQSLLDAARSKSIAAGALPDPKLSVGIENFPVSGPDAGRLQADFMTMQKIGFMQEIPNADKRRAREAVATADVDLTHAQSRVDRLTVRRDAALAWLDLYYAQRKTSLFAEFEHENVLLAEGIQVQVASGRAQAPDAILPKQEAVKLADRHDDLMREQIIARTKLKQQTRAVIDVSLAGEPPSFDVDAKHLREHFREHPEFRTFAAEQRKTQAEMAEARSMKKPDWSVELVFQRRAPQYGNMVSVQFTFDLPFSPATRQEPLIAAKQHELNRLEAVQENMVREHDAELEQLLGDYDTSTRQLMRAKDMALPLAEQKIALQLASYQAGKSDLSVVLAARRERIELLMRIVELQAAQARTAAQLHFAYEENAQ